MKKNIKILSLMLCMALFCAIALPTVVYARTAAEVTAEIEEKKNYLNDLEANIEANKGNIEKAEAAKEEYRVQYEALMALIDEQEIIIDQTEENLEKKSAELSATIQSLNENKELYSERLVAIYKANNSSMLSSVLSVDSMTEFMQVGDALKRISKKDTDFLQQLADERAAFERQKLELEADIADLNNKLEELQGNRDWAAAKMDEMTGIVQAAQAAIEQSEAESENTEEEIAALQAERQAIFAAAAAKGSKKGDGTPRPAGALLWPVPNSWNISSYFGDYRSNTGGHYGIDIPNAEGTPVVAAAAGTVLTATYHYSYGNYIILDHGDGLRTLYAHNSQLLVSEGMYVAAGDTISLMGNTGNSFGAHLHFEVHDNGGRQDPLNYV